MRPSRVLVIVLATTALLPGVARAAGGVDLTASACPATGTHTRSIDCAAGTVERIEGTLTMPADIPDLIAIEAQITFDFGAAHVPPFFDFQGLGAPVLAVSTGRGPGCAAYTNTFAISGAAGFVSATTSLDSVTVHLQCLRPSPLAVVAGQKVFGFTLTLDTSNSSESGVGNLVGCSTPVVAYVDWIRVDSQAGPNQVFSGPDSVLGAGVAVAFNGAPAPHLISVSAGAGGTVSANLFPPDIEPSVLTYNVADGKGRTFTITPQPGYFGDVLVDGVSVGSPTTYTFSNVHGDHSLAVVFGLPTATTTTLVSSPNPSTFGQPVTLTASVSPGNVVGQVDFYEQVAGPPTHLGSALVAGGQASLVLNGLGAGSHVFTATYGGDSRHQSSATTSPDLQQVVAQLTTTALSTSPNPSLQGQSVAMTATVSPTPADGIAVTFFDSTTALGSVNVLAGVARFSTSALAAGNRALHATFVGSAQYAASTSPTLVQAVLTPAAVTLASNIPIAVTGQPVTLTATVSSGTAAGSVNYFDNGVPLGGAPVSNPSGQAILVTGGIQVGRRTLTATYVPCCGSLFAPGTSPGSSQLVVQPPVINSIVDVPHDQGDWVRLTMAACSLDIASESQLPIASYGLWRHVPTAQSVATPAAAVAGAARPLVARTVVTSASLAPSVVAASSFPAGSWELLTNGPGLHLAQYVVALPTIGNAVPDTFVVTASTTVPSIWFISNVASGQSQDNLAPATPTAFGGTFAAGAHLSWDPNAEPDLAGYRLYRGAAADFTPGPGNLVATVVGVAYVDAAPDAGGYYKLSAIDVNGNASPFASAFVAGTTAVGAPPVAVLALAGAWPNPVVGGRMNVRFSLPNSASATLSLFDVGGRVVVVRDVGELGMGAHTLDLADGLRLRPGLYFVRLRQSAETRTTSVVVTD